MLRAGKYIVFVGVVAFGIALGQVAWTDAAIADNTLTEVLGQHDADVSALSEFHKKWLVYSKFYDAASSGWEREFYQRIDASDSVGLDYSTKDYQTKLEKMQKVVSKKLSVPKLSDWKAANAVKAAYDGLLQEIETRIDVAKLVRKMIDSRDFGQPKLDAFKRLIQQADAEKLLAGAALFSAYEALGIGVDRMDLASGGVKRAPVQSK